MDLEWELFRTRAAESKVTLAPPPRMSDPCVPLNDVVYNILLHRPRAHYRHHLCCHKS